MILQKDDKSGWNAWQAFLVTQGNTDLVCDGIPGPTTTAATKAFQSANGLTADGIVGDGTLAAAKAKGFGGLDVPAVVTSKPIVVPSDSHLAIFPVSDRVTQINQAMLARVAPQLQVKVRAFMAAAAADGKGLQVVQSLRTITEQNALFAQGRTKPGKVVTDARGGQSLHNFGCAIDMAVLDASGNIAKDARGEWDDSQYPPFHEWAAAAGLEWGGAWSHFKDMPHVQWTNGMTLAQIQGLYRQGGLGEVWKRLG
jgi:hypothetical protein